MQQNKNQFLEVMFGLSKNPFEYNIFRNDRPHGWRARPNDHDSNIINHIHRHQSSMLPNPQKQQAHLSSSKTVPLNTEVLKERSQMIVHSSKISKDVPAWFKGDTYKYYSRQHYNDLYKHNNLYTIDTSSRDISAHFQHRSQASTPRSRQSEESDNFYMGTGNRQQLRQRNLPKKVQKEIAAKIGSVGSRDFSLPRVQLKIGHGSFIQTGKFS